MAVRPRMSRAISTEYGPGCPAHNQSAWMASFPTVAMASFSRVVDSLSARRASPQPDPRGHST